MSTLNLALQHVALARKPMEANFEDMIRSKNSLADVCKVLQDNPGFQEALQNSMEQPIKILSERFQATKVKEQAVIVGFGARMDDLRFLEPSIESEKV